MNPFYTDYTYIPFDKIKFEDYEPALLRGIEEEDKEFYLNATYQGTPVKERILSLDAERYQRGDLPLKHLLDKYLSYIIQH